MTPPFLQLGLVCVGFVFAQISCRQGFGLALQVHKLMMEQRAGIRKPELGKLKSGGASYDITTRLKGILIRRDLLIHLRQILPKFSDIIDTFAADSWFEQFHVAADGSLVGAPPDKDQCDSGEEDEKAVEQVSTFTAYAPLQALLRKLGKGSFEASICKLARESIPGSLASLSTEMRSGNHFCGTDWQPLSNQQKPRKSSGAECYQGWSPWQVNGILGPKRQWFAPLNIMKLYELEMNSFRSF